VTFLGKTIRLWLASMLVLGIWTTTRLASAQQGAGVLLGTIVDTSSKKPIADVVVTVTSPALQGEEVVVSDSSGFYRIPNLPPGVYLLRLEKEAFRPYTRDGIMLRADTTLRVNAELLPDSLKSEEVVVVGRPPTVDVGSSTTGTNLSSEFTQRVPLSAPGSKGAAARSFESAATVAPGAQADDYGVSISGSTSIENQYVIDGLTVNNPAFGFAGTPLSSEFVKETSVITGGYMPEYGRATGGILNVVTKSGSNEFHGGAFSYFSPGALTGPRNKVIREGKSVSWEPALDYLGDVGFDVGGPILKDKLWFYAGLDVSRSRYKIRRSLTHVIIDPATGEPRVDDYGFTLADEIPDTATSYIAESQTIQAIGKLTYALDSNNRLTLTAYGTPTTSGGIGRFSIDPRTGAPEVDTSTGPGSAESLGHQRPSSAFDASLKWSSEFDNKHVLIDTTVGWHHETSSLLPSDGTRPGSGQGLSNVWSVLWLQNNPGPHSITDFETIPNPAVCTPPRGANVATLCPVSEYQSGGPSDINVQIYNRYQAGTVLTYLFQGLGHHVVKAGANVELTFYENTRGDGGGAQTQESDDGSLIQDAWQYGILIGADKPYYEDPYHLQTKSIIAGGFLQDSWSVLDKVTLNLGIRYDAQYVYGEHGELAMSLPNEWSPRAGVIYDFTDSGRSKLFANYARYYESVPLDLADAALVGEPYIKSYHDRATCDPRVAAQQHAQCQLPSNRVLNPDRDPSDPNRKWFAEGQGADRVDPEIKPQSSDEIVLGGEYEIFADARVGASYTKRWLNRVIEDMSIDGFASWFLANPGYGIAKNFPVAERKYDGVTLYFMKALRDDWLAQISYTISYLRGNVSGLFEPGAGLIQANHTGAFDSQQIMVNTTGPLPGDTRHQIKVFTAKDWTLTPEHGVTTGLSFHGRSGGPTNIYGTFPTLDPGTAYMVPRGSGERLPWQFGVDLQVGYRYALSKEKSLTFTMDVFNLFNFQAAVAKDEVYTNSEVYGAQRLSDVRRADNGQPLASSDVNPNFGNPTAHQDPRVFRFGLRATF
jgi:hypothetical protein